MSITAPKARQASTGEPGAIAGGTLMPVSGRVRQARPWEQGGLRYGRVKTLSVSFASDPGALAALCPPGFRPGDNPQVTVSVQVAEDIDWLAGRGYNIVAVDVAAVFDGERDRDVQGTLCLVMWENMTEPILSGREFSGVPKIYGEIPGIVEDAETARAGVARFGHPIVEFSASGLTPLAAAERSELEHLRREGFYMNYKYIPRLEDDGPDVAYATVYPSSGTCVEAARGQGEVHFHRASFEQNPTQHEIINQIAALPIGEVRSATRATWQPVMLLDRAPRRLR
jgi:acetoacetate decarboxylase